jgi:hypothetical protein
MKCRLLFVLSLVLLSGFTADAQRMRARWKAYRYEWSAGIGASNFLGDLGGANAIGTNGFKDLELSLTRPALTVGFRYKIAQNFSLHSHLTYGHVRGDDKLTEEFFRNNRNLNFKSDIFEFNLNFEAALLNQRQGGIYRLRGVKRLTTYETSIYAFAGIGVFRFNPKGELNGEWYRLQPLGTEGQGLSPARERYDLVQICVPMGIGARYFFNRRMGVGFEFGIRKTFTDYIDDVSKTYYDNEAIKQKYGQVAALLADPRASSLNGTDADDVITAPGQQRGDPRDNDAYMFAVISIHYKLRTGRSNFPVF